MRSIEEIYREMVTDYETTGGLVMSEGGDMSLRLYTMASQIFALENMLEFNRRQAFPQTAEGEYLDRHAAVRGIERGEASHAQGIIRFFVEEAAENDIAIAAGLVCTDEHGTEFVTIVPGVIPAGGLHCDVQCSAVLSGESGNVPAGQICYMPLPPVGVAGCKNPEAFYGGNSGESDASLRKRVLMSYNSLPNGANIAYYEQQALSTDGVYAVQVLPRKNGVGTVDVVVASREGVPDQALVDAVSEKLQSQREICVDISVHAPETVAVDITASIASEDFDSAKAAVEKALSEYFTGALLGKGVLMARLGSVIFGAEGVENYALAAPTADLAPAEAVLPVLGKVTITEMGA